MHNRHSCVAQHRLRWTRRGDSLRNARRPVSAQSSSNRMIPVLQIGLFQCAFADVVPQSVQGQAVFIGGGFHNGGRHPVLSDTSTVSFSLAVTADPETCLNCVAVRHRTASL